jgi:maltodextrin utilization protein YvdJ
LAYQIGLHAITLPILVDTALIIFGLDMVRVLFAPTIILLLVVYVNFTKREKIAVHGDAAS